MNHTDTVPTGEREADAFDLATECAVMEIYEKLKGLFGVQGENLAECLERKAAPTVFEWCELLHGLRGAYLQRVMVDANRMMENDDV